jgi:hypothetical protein
MPADDPRWKVPPSLGVMLQPLETLRRPSGALYRDVTRSEAAMRALSRTRIGSTSRAARSTSAFRWTSPSIRDAGARAADGGVLHGRDDVCRALGMRRTEDAARAVGGALLEHAMVRMAAIAIVDVASGRIEALAGAMSPCTRQEYDGPGRAALRPQDSLSDPLPSDALQNPAVFHDAMPASTIKPIMAAAFLADPDAGARWLAAEQAEIARAPAATPTAQSLRGQLMRSDSARFLDRMFCADRGFGPCARPWAIQKEAAAFGWNGACASPREDCGKRDLLFGQGPDATGEARALALEVPFGRLLDEPLGGRIGAPFRLRAPIALDAAKVKRCAAGPDGKRPGRDDWEKCGGGVVVDVVAEGWGQGHARASALGSAGMMATLAAAANGQASVRRPHLIERVHGVAGPGSPIRSRRSVSMRTMPCPSRRTPPR